MTPTPQTQASIFRIFQNAVWTTEGLPAYATFKNAIITATTMGAKHTGHLEPYNLDYSTAYWLEYLFPDGSLATILSDGSAFIDHLGLHIHNTLYEGDL